MLEAAGTEQARRDALEPAQPGGTVLVLGSLEPEELIPADARRVRDEELTLRGASGHAPRHVRAALAFLASRAYPWEQLVTHEVGLEGVADLLADPPSYCLRAAVRP